MMLSVKEGANVADARTGRSHGRVRRIVVAPLKPSQKDGPREGEYLVEWVDGRRDQVSGADLVSRFTSQSHDFGRVF